MVIASKLLNHELDFVTHYYQLALCMRVMMYYHYIVEVINSVVTQTPHCEIKRVFLNRLTNSRHLHTAEEQNIMTNKQLSDRMSHA